MGVPAFFRWLSEKYPKIIEDIVEERVKLAGGEGSVRVPFDSTRPNPSGLECDNLYIDMNGIIHPCSHPEQGPQPTTEEEMYENVCHYVDRLFRAMRPRKLLYLAIDGVAPRAKMNQQRARRFRSAQEARENLETEQHVRDELVKMGQKVPPAKKAWDSNVITPGTPFMIRLAEYIRFYIRKRISTDKAWKNIRVIFSDASIPGEGEHKIMAHVRLQRSQPGYSPNLVHILHGLDADLIMLALATHEANFYISREEVVFGRKSMENNEQRQLESGYRDKQRQFDESAGETAMQLLENKQKPLVRISIPTLREYLAAEFASCITPGRIPFQPSLERLLDDFVFLCFFVGNDFLPHLPSLDIRDGALDYLFNVYKRILPTLGDYITNHGGQVNLSHVDVILAEVGSIEDHVFAMKYDNEQRDKERRQQFLARKKKAGGRSLDAPPLVNTQPKPKALGRAAKILERQEAKARALNVDPRKKGKIIAPSHMKKDNAAAALALKKSLMMGIKQEGKEQDGDNGATTKGEQKDKDERKDVVKTEDINTDEKNVKQEEKNDVDSPAKEEEVDAEMEVENSGEDGKKGKDEVKSGMKRKSEDIESDDNKSSVKKEEQEGPDGVGVVGDIEDEFDGDDDDDEDEDGVKIDIDAAVDCSAEDVQAFKDKVKGEQQKKLDKYSKNVEDKVRLHEKGWKDRYYSDKCKADDVEANGGREHLFRSYVMGLCWVMKYYYDGCPSWKWYFPFHYAPFASDLRNIERFQSDVKSFELAVPFNPVEQLMGVLPSDSKHAIPKEARWLLDDPESPIIDFYPKDVPVDPNGKAMPWLWVVLLPFIDEDRLLAAFNPTMAKWTKQELFCNARGLDDGYLYIHSAHPLAAKIKTVLEKGKTAKSPKVRLTDGTAYDCPGFTGSFRPPLSNEIYPLDEEVSIEAPSASSKVSFTSHDNLFTEPIHTNECVCAAFTEPLKLSHKSILLPGAIPVPANLTSQDLQIRRPRLNRGGGTIANMGISNGQSYKSGYGSMNISSYERELAEKTGRGHQMYQAGTRGWGTMEPTPKRQRYQAQNPFQAQGRAGVPPPPPRSPPRNAPQWQQQQQQQQQQYQQQQRAGQGYGHNSQQRPPPYHQTQQQNRNVQQGRGQPQHPGGGQGYYNQPQRPGYNNHHQRQQQQRPPQQRQPQPQPPYRGQGPPGRWPNQQQGPPAQRQGFNFSAVAQSAAARPTNAPAGNQTSSRVNANVMSSLKAQLANTLSKNRQSK